MVKFSGKYVAIFATCLAFLFIACEDKDLSKPETGEEEDDNNQPSLLDYSTTQSVKFNLVYDVPKGYVATFDVYGENPFVEEEIKDQDGTMVKRLALNTNLTPISGGISISGNYNLTKTIPGYVKELYVHSTSMFVPTLMKATIQSGVADFKTVNLSGEATRSSSPATRTLADKMPDHYFLYAGDVGATSLNATRDVLIPDATDEFHKPRIAFHEEVPAGVFNRINAAFPEKQRIEPTSPYLSRTSLYLEKAAKVWISIIHTDGTQWDNTLGYFYHNGKDLSGLVHEQRQGLTNKEIIAVPLAKLKATDSKLTLTSGDYIQLQYFNEETQQWVDEFPADLTIGWLLHPKTYDRVNKRLALSGWQWPLCSINTLNTDNHRIDCIVFDAGTEEEPFVCIGFEDDYRRNNYPSADEDFNDVMFHIKTDPADAIEPVEPIPSEEEDVETIVTKKGVLAFEDNWPNEGDYDLNDVVVRYNSKATLTNRAGESVSYLTKLEDRFSLLHTGASFPNKFGFKVNIDPDYVKNITVNGEARTPIKDDFDGIGFIVDVIENALKALPVIPYEPSEPCHFDIVIEFKDGVTEAQWETVCAPYNPFITPKTGTEVHLPYYSPTNRVDLSLFNTGHDRSDVANKVYYVSGEKVLYPFALHLSGVDTFINLGEKQRINETYPNYDNWVKSNGTEYRDWYLK